MLTFKPDPNWKHNEKFSFLGTCWFDAYTHTHEQFVVFVCVHDPLAVVGYSAAVSFVLIGIAAF